MRRKIKITILILISKTNINGSSNINSSHSQISNDYKSIIKSKRLHEKSLSIMDESNNSTYHDSIFKCIAELIMESETDYEYITKALIIIFNTGTKS